MIQQTEKQIDNWVKYTMDVVNYLEKNNSSTYRIVRDEDDRKYIGKYNPVNWLERRDCR